MLNGSDEGLNQQLQELAELETVSGFSQGFYDLIAQLAQTAGEEDGVRLALAGLLDVELRYHREMALLSDRLEVSFADLQSAGERHRIGLESVVELASKLSPPDVLTAAARELIVAECCYHLRRIGEVVEALESVVDLGVSQPLVQFALGYNRYVLALETCTDSSEDEGELVVHDPLEFRVQCLRAVSALEEGLRGEEFDIQLYWWMGVILEAAGLTEAAAHAYDKSTELVEASQEVEEEMGGPTGNSVGNVDAITEDEVRIAGELFKGRFDPSELTGHEPDDSS